MKTHLEGMRKKNCMDATVIAQVRLLHLSGGGSITIFLDVGKHPRWLRAAVYGGDFVGWVRTYIQLSHNPFVSPHGATCGTTAPTAELFHGEGSLKNRLLHNTPSANSFLWDVSSIQVADVLRGAVLSPVFAVDTHYSATISNVSPLFKLPVDAVQRGRDHGLPTYNDARLVSVQS